MFSERRAAPPRAGPARPRRGEAPARPRRARRRPPAGAGAPGRAHASPAPHARRSAGDATARGGRAWCVERSRRHRGARGTPRARRTRRRAAPRRPAPPFLRRACAAGASSARPCSPAPATARSTPAPQRRGYSTPCPAARDSRAALQPGRGLLRWSPRFVALQGGGSRVHQRRPGAATLSTLASAAWRVVPLGGLLPALASAGTSRRVSVTTTRPPAPRSSRMAAARL
jgi:hypothetical protein